MEHIPEELRRIGELLRTQDNQVTDQPMFIVQEKRIVIGFDPDYSQGDEDIVWWIDDCQYFMGDELFEKMERAYEETSDIPENWHRHGFTTEWVYVTACFTEQGCKDYLAKNGHNLKEPRIYADGSYRNAEFRLIRDWLMSLASVEEAKTAEPAILTALQSKMKTIAVQPGDKLQVTIPDGCPQDDAYGMGGLLHAIFGCEVIIVPSDVGVDVIREAKPLH